MKLSRITLSPKKAGNGFISSYSVNIGSLEAKACGLLNDGDENPITVKLVDEDSGQISIYTKKITFTKEMIMEIINLASEYNALSEKVMEGIRNSDGGANLADVYGAFHDLENQNARKASKAERKLKEYMRTLSFETVTDVATLMCIGRDQDYNKSLSPEQRFLDYWAYLSDSTSVFRDEKESLINYIIAKAPLAEYLLSGLDVIKNN